MIHDPPGLHAIKLQSRTSEIDAINALLNQVQKAFSNDKTRLDAILASYNKSLMAANYGQNLTTAEQGMLTGLAQTQVLFDSVRENGIANILGRQFLMLVDHLLNREPVFLVAAVVHTIGV